MAWPGCVSGHSGRPPVLLLLPRAGAGLVLMLGRFPSRDYRARMNGSLQSLRGRASGSMPLLGAPRPQGDARVPCGVQRVPAWCSPVPLLSLAVPDANYQQNTHGHPGDGSPCLGCRQPDVTLGMGPAVPVLQLPCKARSWGWFGPT